MNELGVEKNCRKKFARPLSALVLSLTRTGTLTLSICNLHSTISYSLATTRKKLVIRAFVVCLPSMLIHFGKSKPSADSRGYTSYP